MKDSFLSSFTPSLMSFQMLEAIFVQREELVAEIIEGVRESVLTENKHYRLLTGMRGIGKTHTIALIYHRLREQADLKNKLLIAWLKEEEWGVSSWLDLLLRIFQAVNNLYPEAYKQDLAADVEALYELPPNEAAIKAEKILKEFAKHRTLLLLTENLDEIFKGLGDKGQKQFRAYLQNHDFITIVATSQSLFNGVTSKKSAFYGFFNPQSLDKLSLAEATNLLSNIAEFQSDTELAKFITSQTGQDRIQAIHYLAGGNHRVYVIFSQFLTCELLDELVQPVMQTLDELTPYYQARMQWLSPQQRKIIELLCDRRNAVSVKDIARRCFITHQTASSQLKDLLTKGYVSKNTAGREALYELQEPLMRICLEVKKQRGEPIKLFVDFLRIWYTNRQLKSRLTQLPDNCLERSYIQQALKLEPIFSEVNSIDELDRDNNFYEQLKAYVEQGDHESILELCDRAIKINPEDYRSWGNRGYALNELGKYEAAIQSYDRAIKINPKHYSSWYNRGNTLCELGKYEAAIQSYDRAIKINPKHYSSWYNRGNTLCELGKYEAAIQSYDRAIKINPEDYLLWGSRGYALDELGKYEAAIESYDRAIKINPEDYLSWGSRGNALDELGKYEAAIQSYDRAIKINPEHYQSWGNRGYALDELGKYEAAIQSYDRAIKINPEDYQSWGNRGYALNELGKYEAAIASFEQALEINAEDNRSLLCMAKVLFKLIRWREGFTYLDRGLKSAQNLEGGYLGNTPAIVKIIFESQQKRAVWQERIETLVKLYDRYEVVAELSTGITANIPDLLSEMVSNKAARTWLEAWQTAGKDKPGLEIPLRWLKTAVEYKEKKGDQKVLLQLPKEERDLFKTLLEDKQE